MVVTDSLEMEVPPATAWGILGDVDQWPAWTPTMTSVRRGEGGPFQVGSTALIKASGLPACLWKVTAMTAGESFTWETRRPGMQMRATHQLVPTAAGCRSEQRLEMSGWLVTLLTPFVRKSAASAIQAENRGLRDACRKRAVTTV